MLLLDALLNFSRKYLNETRGGTMDTPLVLTPAIDPMEVDDEAHTIEIVNSYPLEFYHAAEKITPPGDVKIKTVKSVLGKPEQYAGLPLTHPGGTLDKGPIRTQYVQLNSIPEKITTQFDLQLRIKAVDAKNALW
jgi:DNA polymerase II large subunit